jgi:alginate O-acetyltransferase complex protein AlgI
MIFPSNTFLFVFLPLFLLCYSLLGKKNIVILAFSLLFYAWGEGVFVLLLIASICLNYFVSKQITNRPNSKFGLWIGVSANLLFLFHFKYFGFVIGDILALSVSDELVPHLPLGSHFSHSKLSPI